MLKEAVKQKTSVDKKTVVNTKPRLLSFLGMIYVLQNGKNIYHQVPRT